MRWEALFADLEAQLLAVDQSELAAEVSDRTRREVARVGLVHRARAAVGATVTVAVGAAGTVSGRLAGVGPDWWLVEASAGVEELIAAAAISWVGGLPAQAQEPETVSAVAARLGLAYALRGVARDRAAVTLVLRDAATVTGTIDRVGADFVDVAEHPPGEPRRQGAVRTTRTVPFTALARVRRS